MPWCLAVARRSRYFSGIRLTSSFAVLLSFRDSCSCSLYVPMYVNIRNGWLVRMAAEREITSKLFIYTCSFHPPVFFSHPLELLVWWQNSPKRYPIFHLILGYFVLLSASVSFYPKRGNIAISSKRLWRVFIIFWWFC